MNKKNIPADDPLAGIRHKIGELQEDINAIKTFLAKPSFWAKVWQERNWSFWLITAVLGAIGTASWYIGGLILDKHVQSAVTAAANPLQTDVRRIDTDVQQIKAMIRVLQAQIAAQKYATSPPKELKAHHEELKRLQTTLAQSSPTSPGYWPAAFQVIELLSRSNFADIDKVAARPESDYSNLTSNPPGAFGVMENQRVVLRNHIEGLIFKNSIIRFDSNVELVNDVFIDCVFVFPVQENPSKPLQEIGKTLLASDLSKVTLNAS